VQIKSLFKYCDRHEFTRRECKDRLFIINILRKWIISLIAVIAERSMNFSRYIAGTNDRRRIKGWIFTALGLGDAFVIYQKALLQVARESFVAACVAAFFVFYGSNTDRKMNYESETELRNFSFFPCVSSALATFFSTIVRPLSQSFYACRFKSIG